MKNMVMPEQIYNTTEGKRFKVTKVVKEEDGIWVYYTNLSDGSEYHCLIDAFRYRYRFVEANY